MMRLDHLNHLYHTGAVKMSHHGYKNFIFEHGVVSTTSTGK